MSLRRESAHLPTSGGPNDARRRYDSRNFPNVHLMAVKSQIRWPCTKMCLVLSRSSIHYLAGVTDSGLDYIYPDDHGGKDAF